MQACPFSRFPYLLARNASSAPHRLGVALATLKRRGSALASADCGFAYHHMLSQAYFLWPERTWARSHTVGPLFPLSPSHGLFRGYTRLA